MERLNKSKNKTDNNKFSSRIGFIAAASGAAVGLGNIWKFPYEVGANGGAWFLLIYFLFVIILGFPILVAKIAFGRSVGTGVFNGYRNEGRWKWLGFIPAFLCLILFSFYSVITAWILGYGIEIFKGTLLKQNEYSEFFKYFINDIPKNLFYNFLIISIISLIISFGIQKGIERASKIMMPILLIVLIGLIIYSLTLNNASAGLKFYLLPDISLLTKKSVFSALSHAFWSLTIGSSVMITFGAYAKNDVDIIKDTTSIVISDVLVAFLAGLLLFPLIFSIGIKPNEGPALIFIALPFVFKNLGIFKGSIVGLSFFLLLVFAAITSAISMLEITTNYMMQRYKISRKKSIILLSGIAYILGIPCILSNGKVNFLSKIIIYKGKYLNFIDILGLIIEIGFPIVAFLFCIFIKSRWKKYKINEQINSPNKKSNYFNKYIYICVSYLGPILIGLVLLSNFI
ncbi:MAG: sodium-dependent transporter [Bacteroidetes bacterium]|nr:sodium-dependent transporter [Bacteroidota bacterium]